VKFAFISEEKVAFPFVSFGSPTLANGAAQDAVSLLLRLCSEELDGLFEGKAGHPFVNGSYSDADGRRAAVGHLIRCESSLDRGAHFACDSVGLLRRDPCEKSTGLVSAESVGGVSGNTVAEDFEDAVEDLIGTGVLKSKIQVLQAVYQ